MTELLVSLAILSIALVAFFELKRDLHHRQETELRLIEAASNEANGLSLLRRINPMRESVGFRKIGKDLTLKWKAVQLGKARPILEWRGRETPDSAALFSVHYAIERQGSKMVEGDLELVGWTDTTSDEQASIR
ncbi:hypothetical protein OKA06_00865 [Novosphingobium sp. MW5]|nr:hypothetical protein [Novosphingobium sp. MW5]